MKKTKQKRNRILPSTKYQIRDTAYEHGQALVMLISFVAIAIVVISSALINMFINMTAATRTQVGDIAYSVAESGAENALLRLLRDTSYAGETLAVGSGSAVVTVSGTNPKTIISTGTYGSFKRKIQVVASDSAGILSVTSWKEQ
ncbi:MAG: hypothetical protein WAT72_04570 [Microgenomates group bacterium]|jgi:hypothetical protein|nr:hypothetical protein [Candidatus Woesebacteria bacterium]MBP6883206.1 hypothetical protein [Candidatus Woesebacteria bacterium]QQR63939.1 MAG: hypothetical protein IPH70_00145 [Candidatus Roizmanbacteria bacterium]